MSRPPNFPSAMIVNCSFPRSLTILSRQASATSESSVKVAARLGSPSTSRRMMRNSCLCEPLKQNRTQLTEYLARARRDMETGGALCQIRKRLGRSFLVAENFQINFGGFGVRSGNDPFKNRAHSAHLFL